MRLGGGSNSDYLSPTHRIDQPCTGLVLFAKNKKAASRVAAAWKGGRVSKTYLCVVEAESVDAMRRHSEISSAGGGGGGREDEDAVAAGESSGWYAIAGALRKRGKRSVEVDPMVPSRISPDFFDVGVTGEGGGGGGGGGGAGKTRRVASAASSGTISAPYRTPNAADSSCSSARARELGIRYGLFYRPRDDVPWPGM